LRCRRRSHELLTLREIPVPKSRRWRFCAAPAGLAPKRRAACPVQRSITDGSEGGAEPHLRALGEVEVGRGQGAQLRSALDVDDELDRAAEEVDLADAAGQDVGLLRRL
jgi:hypothetical protein